MNRLIRGILYITAGCVGIGVAALVLGLVLGGGKIDFRDDDMYHQAKNAVKAVRKKVVSESEKVVTPDEVAPIDGESGQVYREDGTEFLKDLYDYENSGYDHHLLTAEASDVQNLRIILKHGGLDIGESQDNRIRVFLDGPTDHIVAECSNGEVAIEDNRQGNESRKDVNIRLEIPNAMQFTEWDIQVDAGVVDVDSDYAVKADTLTLNANAGDISICDVWADVLNASVGAGLIDIQDGAFGTVDMECGVGQLDVTASITQDSRISCGMGAVDMRLNEDVEKFNYVISCGMGSVEIGNNSYSGIARAKRIDNGGSAELTIDCGMGSICIE